MKKKEDIAVLIKQKLDGMHASSSEPSWETVASSLKRRKKKRLILWWTGSLISLLLIALFVQNFKGVSSNEQTDTQTNIEANSPDQLNQDPALNKDLKDSELTDSGTKNQQQLPDNQAGSNAVIVGNESGQQANKPSQVTVTQFDSVDPTQGAEVKTTYYYYRDSDKTEIITKDKKVLDSLLNNQPNEIKTQQYKSLKAQDSLK